MKILYASEFWISELQGGAELEAHDFCLRLMKQGYEVEVVTFSETPQNYPYKVHNLAIDRTEDHEIKYAQGRYLLLKFLQEKGNNWDAVILYGNLFYPAGIPIETTDYKVIGRIWDMPISSNQGWEDWSWKSPVDLVIVGTDYHISAMDTHNTTPKLSLPPANFMVSKSVDFDYEEWKSRPYDFGFINPITHKGISLVSHLVGLLPNKSFLIKKGNYQHQHMVDALDKWYSNVTMDKNYYDTMDDFYRQCRYILYPSLQEGFGMVTYEAMSQGCLVFANDHPIIRSATGEGPVYIDAYPAKCNQQFFKYLGTTSSGQFNYDMEAAAEEWKDVIEETIADPKLVLSHLEQGLEAGSRLQETSEKAYQKLFKWLES